MMRSIYYRILALTCKATASLRGYLFTLISRISQHHLFLLSGSLAFSLLLCVLPLILIIFSILGHLFERELVVSQISDMVFRLIPHWDTAERLNHIIQARMAEFTNYKGLVIGVAERGLTARFTSRPRCISGEQHLNL